MSRILTRIFTVLMLTMVSMGAWAQIDVQIANDGKFDGGTIEMTDQKTLDDGVEVTITVAPEDGYTIKKSAITVVSTYPPSGSRADTRTPEIAETLTLYFKGSADADTDDPSAKRDYTFIVPTVFGAWVQDAKFQSSGKKGGDRSTGPVTITTEDDITNHTEKLYLIQSYCNEAFYMRNNNKNTNKLNTSNIVTANSEFYFLDAGIFDDIQYYYIVHKGTGKYIYVENVASGKEPLYGDAPASDATDEVKDKYRFKIIKNSNRDAYNIIVKLNDNILSLNKNGGNSSTKDIQQFNADDDNSCWNFVAKADYTKTTPPFTLSTISGEKYYYNIQNNATKTLYMAPGATSVCTFSSVGNEKDKVWYFVKATEDDYLDYYYIIHPSTGKYLRYSLGNTESAENAVGLTDYNSSEQGRFLFIIVPGSNNNEKHATTTESSTYCIAPKNVMVQRVENTISLRKFTTNSGEGTPVAVFKERNGNNDTHWNFISTTFTLACDPPVITYDEATNTITMSHSEGATIYYTDDGTDPIVPVGNSTTQTYSGPFNPRDGISVIKAVAVTQADGSDMSEQALQYFYVTVNNSEDITDMNGNYRLDENFTSSSTIGSSEAPFKGIIDGGFHAFSLNHALIDVAEDATIKNIVISNASISGSGNVGSIVNTAKGTMRIYNCGVQAGSVSGGTNVGGLVGLIESGSKVRVVNCYNFADVSGSSNAAGIVGKNEGTVGDVRIALCMMYGNVSNATTISPVYTGNHTNNVKNFTEYNYYLYSTEKDASGQRIIRIPYTDYNDQLAIDKEDYLTRFPFYRHILNTHRELASYFLFGDYAESHVDEIGHWTVKKGDNAPKYPIIEPWEKNRKSTPTQTNNNLPNTTADYAGKLLSTMGNSGYLSVSIKIGSNSYSASLPITDMDTLRNDYTYGKVILPFANEYEVNTNYDQICTGWKITKVGSSISSSVTNYNFADRGNLQKDIYDETTNPFIYAQGGYYIVPTGVTSIEITANFATAYYLSDATYEIGYNSSYSGRTGLGGNTPSTFNGKTVYNSLATAVSNMTTTTTNPHKQAIVLVGNYHYDLAKTDLATGKGFTLMSIDADNNQEPDYGFYSIAPDRPQTPALRFDFLPIISLGMAAKVNGSYYYPGVPIWKPRGWYEQTETTVSIMNQFELDSGNFTNDENGNGQNPCIINGGYFVQMIRSNNTSCSKVSYFKLGGNAYIKEFYPGSHSNQTNKTTTIVPVNVTGGQVVECYMTGYKSGAKAIGSNIRFWCSGGKIGKFLGAYMDKPLETSNSTNDNPGTVNMTAQVDHALIGRFFGGGTSQNAAITGDISVTINNSKVDFYCGGPEFGDMSDGKIVITTANNTKFGEYYGAGFGGTAITYSPVDGTPAIGSSVEFTGYTYNTSRLTRSGSLGLATCYKFEFLMHSANKSQLVARFITGYADFNLATTGNVTNNLTGCTIENDFYGAGCQGKVNGTVTSTLTNCTIKRCAFGGGYKAESNEVKVYPAAAPTLSTYNGETGIFSEFGTTTPETFTWEQGAGDNPTADDANDKLYTSKNVTLTDLGNVTGAISITIDGGSVTEDVFGGGNESKSLNNSTVNIQNGAQIAGNVYGGGNEADVQGNTNVNITGGTITQNVFGGGKGEADHFECKKAMVGIDGDGTNNPDGGTTVNITAGTVKGNVYGGGEVGRVEKNTSVTIGTGEGSENNSRSPIIEGSVFGAGKGKNTHGYSALVRGNTTVTVQGDTWVKQSVYGGGEIASVGRYKVDETTGLPTVPNGGGKCTVTIQGYAEIGPNGMKMTADGGPDDAGHVFGAGKGVLPYEGYDDSAKPQHTDGYKDTNGNWVDVPKEYTAYSDLAADQVNENYFNFIKTLALASETVVTIGGHAFVKGSVYGGSENGFVQADTHVTIKEDCQIGNGDDVNRRYTTAEWAYDGSSNNTSLKECASWSYASPYSPYDKYAGVYDALGGAVIATDGHTFYGNVFGGGSGYYPYKPGRWFEHAGAVYGKTQVDIDGGHILTSVYGGNEMTDVKGKCTINMSGGTVGVPRTHEQMRNHPVTCYVFGAGKGDQRRFFNTWTNVASTEVNISGTARIYGSTFGGGEDGHVIGNAVTTIENGADVGSEETKIRYPYIGTTGTSAVDGNIFGGGRGFSETALTAGVVGGNVEVNISDGTILGSVFGGGRLASVGTFFADETNPNYGKMQEDEENVTHGHIKINISGGSIGAVDGSGNLKNSNYTIGDVFGGCKGSSNNNADSHKFGLAKNTEITISGTAKINRSVFGGGEAGNVTGHVTVTLEGGTVGEDVYGGGALADTNIANWDFDENTWAENKTSDSNKTTVNLYGGTIKGDAFGGGLGQKTGFNGADSDIEATTYGDITVNLGKEDESSATAFNITYDNSGTADAPVQVVNSGRVFGTNNLNGSPKGNVTVNVYKTVTGTLNGVNNKRTESGNLKNSEAAHSYEVAAVYGGGNLADYTATGKMASVIIHSCDVSVQDVYGGGNAAKVPETDVLVKGAWEIEHVFGGGNGKDKYKKGNAWIENAGADVTGNTNTLMIGGYIHEAYGGSNEKGTIGGNVYLNTNAEDDRCDCSLKLEKIVGAGKNAEVWGDIITVLGCQPETLVPEYIGGADNADVHGNVELTITSGTFGKVFGGNNIGGVIEGHIKVNIEETGCRPIVIGELYGCGNDAAYSVYGYKLENGELVPRTSMDDGTAANPPTTPYSGTQLYADPEVNVISCTRIGQVFGGGLGEHGTVWGNPTVNINQTYGKAYTTGDNPEYTATATTLGEIGDVFGGGDQANVVGNTHVNIGTVPKVTLTSVHDNASTEIKENEANVIGANITGNVYGGGNKANVTGNTNVNIGKATTTP